MRARSHAPRTHFQRSRCGVWAENTAATRNLNSSWSAFKISARWATTVQRRHWPFSLRKRLQASVGLEAQCPSNCTNVSSGVPRSRTLAEPPSSGRSTMTAHSMT